MTGLRWVQLPRTNETSSSATAVPASLVREGADESPTSLPVSYGYYADSGDFYFRLSFPPEVPRRTSSRDRCRSSSTAKPMRMAKRRRDGYSRGISGTPRGVGRRPADVGGQHPDGRYVRSPAGRDPVSRLSTRSRDDQRTKRGGLTYGPRSTEASLTDAVAVGAPIWRSTLPSRRRPFSGFTAANSPREPGS